MKTPRALSLALRWLAALLCWPSLSQALPLYTAREGRTCDNCHTLPNSWKNPEQAKDRKCTLSCSACHVDPTGGGLRNTAGRFFGQSSLAMTLATHRGYKDQGRFVAPFMAALERPAEEDAYLAARAGRDDAKRAAEEASALAKAAQEAAAPATAALVEVEARYQAALASREAAAASTAPDAAEVLRAAEEELARQTSARAEAEARAQALLASAQEAEAHAKRARALYEEARGQVRARYAALQEAKNRVPALAFGAPLGGSSARSYDPGRYGGMNADPLLSLGLDVRMASWSVAGETLFFPMQFDTQVAVQPVEHLTAYVNAGVLAQSKGFSGTAESAHPYAVKDAMLILNELPYNAYAKVGRFVPAFGTRLDDHTSFVRRDIELDLGLAESRVFGAEFGIAPNYPYVNVGVFRPNERDSFADGDEPGDVSFVGEPGIGAAVSAGYRELGWQLGLSAMSRRRAIEEGGDTDTLSLQWGLNPWFYSERIPLTYLGEAVVGRYQRPITGSETAQLAAFHELDYSARNGVVLRAKYDFSEPDVQVADDEQHRIGLGADLTLLPGLRLSGMARASFLNGRQDADGTGGDLIIFLRGWL